MSFRERKSRTVSGRPETCRTMLLLLLALTSLGFWTEGLEFSAPVNFDISKCPICYFGTNFSQLFVSFSENRTLSLCFDKFSDSSGHGQCVRGPRFGSENFTFEIVSGELNFSTFGIQREIPHIKNSPKCAVKIGLERNKDLYLINYGPQTAFYFEAKRVAPNATADFGFWVGGKLLFSRSGHGAISADLTGCQDGGGVPYTVNYQKQVDPAHCTVTACGPMGALETSSTCRRAEICHGNNRCLLEKSCSLMGPTVLDVTRAVGVVRGLCVYTLLNGAELQVLGSYSDRRLSDAPFLSSVTLRTDRTITLRQGGAVEVEGEGEVRLNRTAVSFHGVELFKTSSGITAVHLDKHNSSTHIFYDGTLLHMSFSEGDGPRFHSGLCINATSSEKDMTQSAGGCDTLMPDSSEDGINCTSVKSSCTSFLATLPCDEDPAPFVTACAELLCRYPSVDGLHCHFLDAYARTCHLQDWREAAGCAAPVCLNHECGSAEFCAIGPSGEAACFCRASFARQYRTSNFSYGELPVCDFSKTSITLFACLLEEQGFDYRQLHLRDPECKGVVDHKDRTVSFSFDRTDTCHGSIEDLGNIIIYNNIIQNNQGSDVVHEKQLSINFTCSYVQQDVRTTTVKITDGSSAVLDMSGQFSYEIYASLFVDRVFKRAVTSDMELALRQKLWVRLEAWGVGRDMGLRMDRCWATNEPSPSAVHQHNLITNGCPDPGDGTVNIISNGGSLTASFSFRLFRFMSRDHSDVFLHCQVRLCPNNEDCVPSCLGEHELR